MKKAVMKVLRALAMFLVWVAVAPSALVGFLTCGFVWLAWAERDATRWERGVWCVTLATDSWPMRTWYKDWAGTAIGPYCIMFAPQYAHDPVIIAHERHHCLQQSGEAVAGLVLAVALVLVGNWWLALAIWALINRIMYTSASIDAFARGGKAYADNEMEVSAYAAGEEQAPKG